MAIPPSPFRQHCSACNWQSQVIAPRSDALSPAEFSALEKVCPQCGSEDLRHETVSGVSKILLSVLHRMAGRL